MKIVKICNETEMKIIKMLLLKHKDKKHATELKLQFINQFISISKVNSNDVILVSFKISRTH